MSEKMKQVEQVIAIFEKAHSSIYSESSVQKHLDDCAQSDSLNGFLNSKTHSCQPTYQLEQEKRELTDIFHKHIELINNWLEFLEPSHPYVSKLEAFKRHINKIQNIVQNYENKT